MQRNKNYCEHDALHQPNEEEEDRPVRHFKNGPPMKKGLLCDWLTRQTVWLNWLCDVLDQLNVEEGNQFVILHLPLLIEEGYQVSDWLIYWQTLRCRWPT